MGTKKKEIIDKSPNSRTVDEKNMLQSLSRKIRKFPKHLIDGIQKQFPRLQRTPKTAEQRKEQGKECKRQKREQRIAESQKLCEICKTSNHRCRKCKKTVCNGGGERDPSSDNEMHIMHKESDTRC